MGLVGGKRNITRTRTPPVSHSTLDVEASLTLVRRRREKKNLNDRCFINFAPAEIIVIMSQCVPVKYANKQNCRNVECASKTFE